MWQIIPKRQVQVLTECVFHWWNGHNLGDRLWWCCLDFAKIWLRWQYIDGRWVRKAQLRWHENKDCWVFGSGGQGDDNSKEGYLQQRIKSKVQRQQGHRRYRLSIRKCSDCQTDLTGQKIFVMTLKANYLFICWLMIQNLSFSWSKFLNFGLLDLLDIDKNIKHANH